MSDSVTLLVVLSLLVASSVPAERLRRWRGASGAGVYLPGRQRIIPVL